MSTDRILEGRKKGGKLDPKWLGPYTIAHNFGKGFYSLSDGGDIIVKRISDAYLKIYIPLQPSEETSYVNKTRDQSFNELRFIIN